MKDQVNKEGKRWEFDEEVANVFTDMLERSIPQYSVMRSLTDMVVDNFVYGKDNVTIADIGCSNGLAVRNLVDKYPSARFVLSDVSEPMLKICNENYQGRDNVIIVNHDLRHGVPFENADVVISSLTLQFTPIEYRLNILQNIYDNMKDGGAFVLIEKVIGNTSALDNMFVNKYYSIKSGNGYSNELIQSKRKSLEGVLVPLTSHFNEEMLKSTGFKQIDCFWRCLNFTGFVAIK